MQEGIGERGWDGVEALLFDLGRVVIELDSARIHARWAELAGLPAAELERRSQLRVAGSEAFQCHERGEISDAEFFTHLRAALEIDLTDAELEDGWNATFLGEMPGIRRILSRLEQILPLYAFTNTNAAHHAYWSVRFADVLAAFRKVYISHQMGPASRTLRRFLP